MYNYLVEIKNDIMKNYETDYLLETSENQLYDEMWTDDSITGNGSGSYTFSTYQAEENIAHNMDLLREAIEEFGGNFGEALKRGAEHCDVIIRCYLLGQAISEIKQKIEE